MLIPFAFRYGWVGALWVMLPPVSALILTPAILSLVGAPFNFFHAMALVLVLAIGVDYSVFCAESREASRSTTMVAIFLAATVTLLSFGLLAFSTAPAISSFGAMQPADDLAVTREDIHEVRSFQVTDTNVN